MPKVIDINSRRERDPADVICRFINDPSLSCDTRLVAIYIYLTYTNCNPKPIEIQKYLRFGDGVWRRVSKELQKAGYLKLHKGGKGQFGSRLEFDANGRFKYLYN